MKIIDLLQMSGLKHATENPLCLVSGGIIVQIDNTQNIESVWNKYKYVLNIHKSIVASKVNLLLKKLVWKNNLGFNKNFEELLIFLRL
ncbi:hypothetical protein A0H76_1514 [Hepatospora eriocheir]|uniref:Uncharacterized protein n=1 Tax=Hepatospora eriocheir TaxID=1081669 RepID=A0A1X0QGY2_9MICR|nr:hypothetical protein A0H76_1514 [Hepatospora eriocheir]